MSLFVVDASAGLKWFSHFGSKIYRDRLLDLHSLNAIASHPSNLLPARP